MPTYSNGYIPEHLLVVFKRGRNNVDGDWYHALSPATYARHLALVDRAYARTGRTLKITDGFGAYRPYAAQVLAKRLYGNGAADPGTSSHGGFWEGKQTLAMDYGNWAWVYESGFAEFKEDCAEVGLWAGAIMPDRGYPREEWHVVDLNPWSAVPAFDGAKPFVPTVKTPTGGKMTVYARRDDGLVVAIPEGGPTHNYSSPEEYNRHRETVAVINGQRQKDGQPLITLPPALSEIVTMTSERLNDLIYSQGAVLSPTPVVRIDIPEVSVPPIDVDAVAQAVNDEADRRARERLG